jgi:hypothetical protein
VITTVALAAGGTIVGRITGHPLPRSGLRQLALGGLAIAVTFAVGSLIGGHGPRVLAPPQPRWSGPQDSDWPSPPSTPGGASWPPDRTVTDSPSSAWWPFP